MSCFLNTHKRKWCVGYFVFMYCMYVPKLTNDKPACHELLLKYPQAKMVCWVFCVYVLYVCTQTNIKHTYHFWLISSKVSAMHILLCPAPPASASASVLRKPFSRLFSDMDGSCSGCDVSICLLLSKSGLSRWDDADDDLHLSLLLLLSMEYSSSSCASPSPPLVRPSSATEEAGWESSSHRIASSFSEWESEVVDKKQGNNSQQPILA